MRWHEEPIESETRDIDGQEITMQLWANMTTGTWTLIGTDGSIMCVLGVGRDLQGRTLGDLLNPTEIRL